MPARFISGLRIETWDGNHTDWVLQILDEVGFCYYVVGRIVRLHGYLPKSFEGLDDLSESLQ